MSEKKRKQAPGGKCEFCGKEYSKGGMSRHLAACKSREEANVAAVKSRKKPQQIYHVMATGKYNPEYWMHFEVPERGNLLDIDDYLRDMWLECCGHLSSFMIGGRTYSKPSPYDMGFDLKDENINIGVKQVLSTGDTFEYIYDYGSSTELLLKVVDIREGVAIGKGKAPIHLMAQNSPPDIKCAVCQEQDATQVCTFCIYEPDDSAWLCDTCKSKHHCVVDEGGDEYMLLPVMNSPRVGVCAYGSTYDDYDFDDGELT